MENVNAHKRETAKRIILIFFGGVMVISASTSFGFFFNFFDTLIPPSLPVIGGQIGAIISGVIGVLLFDVSTAVWLYAYLYNAETPEQRSTALSMSAGAFVGAAAASVAHLSLSATRLDALPPETKGWISLAALIVVIIGVVANFGAAVNYQKNTLDSQEAVRQADRRDTVIAAEAKHQKNLDKLVESKVTSILESKSDELANIQANRIAQDFLNRESAKYSPDFSPIGTKKPRRLSGRPTPPQPNQNRPNWQTYYPGEIDVGADGLTDAPKQWLDEVADHFGIPRAEIESLVAYAVNKHVRLGSPEWDRIVDAWKSGKLVIPKQSSTNGAEPDFLRS
jgi:hypothetical protein